MKQSFRPGNQAVQDLADRLAIQQLLSQSRLLHIHVSKSLAPNQSPWLTTLDMLYKEDATIDFSAINACHGDYQDIRAPLIVTMSKLFAAGTTQESHIHLDNSTEVSVRHRANGYTRLLGQLGSSSSNSTIIAQADNKPCIIDEYSQVRGVWRFTSRRLVLEP